MAAPVNPFASPAKITAVSLKLLPSEAGPIEALAETTGLHKPELWSLVIHTTIAALAGDMKTVQQVTDYVTALKAEKAKKA
jgi:hypothetical protein